MPAPEPYASIIAHLPTTTVVVVGDFVLDRFVFGRSERISREAPVLILRQTDEQTVPGGGGNTALNLAALGAGVRAVSVVGDDAAGTSLCAALSGAGADLGGVRSIPGVTTRTKTRVLGGLPFGTMQQIVRIDAGAPLPEDPDRDRALLAALADAVARGADAVIVSDYAGGVVTPTVRGALRALAGKGFPVIVDSRRHLLEFAGFTSATPNDAELEAALGRPLGGKLEALEAAGREVRRRLGLQTLLVTRGKQGMTLFGPDDTACVHIPVAGPDEVTDVTGAGDTVIATFTAARAAGADWQAAARLANVAAGNVVQKRGTATLSPAELTADASRYLAGV